MRWKILCIFATAALLACERGSETAVFSDSASYTCQTFASQPMMAYAEPADPYQSRGKVIIETPDTASALGANSDAIVLLHEGTKLALTVDETCRAQGEVRSGLSPAITNVPTPSGIRSYTWTLPRPYTLAEIRETAENDECIVGISNSVTAKTQEFINDPLLAQQGHLRSLRAMEAFRVAFNPKATEAVTIAVIDTGIEMGHDDLRKVLWRNPGEIPGNNIDDDENGYVDDVYGYNFALDVPSPQYVKSVPSYQHGTHVAGLAAAQGGNALGGAGVMPFNTRIMMLNVFGGGAGAVTADIANAIRYAVDNGASVINLSLGGEGRSAGYESALAYAIRKGATVFAAAGNDGSELSSSFFMSPASYAREFPGMMAVGSVDSIDGALSTFSNFSPFYVQMAAPGSDDSRQRLGLLSTWPGNSYQRAQGTSMSTPIMAGAAALTVAMLRSRGYLTPPVVIERILQASARKDPTLIEHIQGGRVLDLKRLVEYVVENYPIRGGEPVEPVLPPPGC